MVLKRAYWTHALRQKKKWTFVESIPQRQTRNRPQYARFLSLAARGLQVRYHCCLPRVARLVSLEHSTTHLSALSSAPSRHSIPFLRAQPAIVSACAPADGCAAVGPRYPERRICTFPLCSCSMMMWCAQVSSLPLPTRFQRHRNPLVPSTRSAQSPVPMPRPPLHSRGPGCSERGIESPRCDLRRSVSLLLRFSLPRAAHSTSRPAVADIPSHFGSYLAATVVPLGAALAVRRCGGASLADSDVTSYSFLSFCRAFLSLSLSPDVVCECSRYVYGGGWGCSPAVNSK